MNMSIKWERTKIDLESAYFIVRYSEIALRNGSPFVNDGETFI
ncbi:2904_t:CDS:2, partial [Dentiscutata heterogama]